MICSFQGGKVELNETFHLSPNEIFVQFSYLILYIVNIIKAIQPIRRQEPLNKLYILLLLHLIDSFKASFSSAALGRPCMAGASLGTLQYQEGVSHLDTFLLSLTRHMKLPTSQMYPSESTKVCIESWLLGLFVCFCFFFTNQN